MSERWRETKVTISEALLASLTSLPQILPRLKYETWKDYTEWPSVEQAALPRTR
jgi:hypothetical protein